MYVLPLQQEPAANGTELANGIKYVRPGNLFEPNFRLFRKIEVNGENEHPLYKFLKVRRLYEWEWITPHRKRCDWRVPVISTSELYGILIDFISIFVHLKNYVKLTDFKWSACTNLGVASRIIVYILHSKYKQKVPQVSHCKNIV